MFLKTTHNGSVCDLQRWTRGISQSNKPIRLFDPQDINILDTRHLNKMSYPVRPMCKRIHQIQPLKFDFALSYNVHVDTRKHVSLMPFKLFKLCRLSSSPKRQNFASVVERH